VGYSWFLAGVQSSRRAGLYTILESRVRTKAHYLQFVAHGVVESLCSTILEARRRILGSRVQRE